MIHEPLIGPADAENERQSQRAAADENFGAERQGVRPLGAPSPGGEQPNEPRLRGEQDQKPHRCRRRVVIVQVEEHSQPLEDERSHQRRPDVETIVPACPPGRRDQKRKGRNDQRGQRQRRPGGREPRPDDLDVVGRVIGQMRDEGRSEQEQQAIADSPIPS